MRKAWLVAAFSLLTTGLMGSAAYASAPTGDITIVELKMTGSETLVLENNSSTSLNLSNYLVEYFNKSTPTSLAVPTSTQQLPAVSISPHQAILLNSDTSLACGAAVIANLSFSLSDTSGYLMISKIGTQFDGSLVFAPQDHVSWTSATTGADITKVPSNTTDPAAVWYRKLSDGSWQQAELGTDCNVLFSLISPTSSASFVDWSDGDEAPATVVSLASTGSGGTIPSSDIGLAAPQITEVLPNPASPQTDDEDEFIEVYNPNSSDFDLSGFKLEVGTSTLHDYKIPDGTILPAKSFKAFFSIDTNLSMSNTSGQAKLLDPLGTVLSQTDIYSSAKDGQSWALANGHWYWTSSTTPGQPNVVNQASSTKSAKTTSKSAGAVKGASTSASNQSSSAPGTLSQATPLHPLVLAAVGTAALIYACYEYRADLANHYDKLRRNLQDRRAVRK